MKCPIYILSWCLCLNVLSLRMSTVDFQRRFTTTNLTKTSLQTRMSIPHLCTLMMISANGVNRRSFDFDNAFQSWCSKKDRRIANV